MNTFIGLAGLSLQKWWPGLAQIPVKNRPSHFLFFWGGGAYGTTEWVEPFMSFTQCGALINGST